MKNKVKELRRERLMKQEEFAQRIGISRATLSKIENGGVDPGLEMAYTIAEIFHSRIEEVFPNPRRRICLLGKTYGRVRHDILKKSDPA